MRRASISDIAALAEVSTATVDRVLNGRPGVAAANRQRVHIAAKALGYLADRGQGDAALPARASRVLHSLGRSEFMHDLGGHDPRLRGEAAACRLLQDPRDRRAVAQRAGKCRREDRVCRPMASASSPSITRSAAPRSASLSDAGMRVITIASDVLSTPRSAYVGVDNRIAGRTAGLVMGRMARAGGGKRCAVPRLARLSRA